MGAVIGVSGVLLFVIGMSTPSQRTMNEEDIAAWKPSAEQLPDANRIMYRVDVTIDEPKKTTILCGPCGVVTEARRRSANVIHMPCMQYVPL